MQLRDKVAIVTGGASGLGAATVRAFHDAGAKVGILDRAKDTGEALARELGEHALFTACDVTSPTDVEAAVRTCRERFGAVHIGVGCAGIGFAAKVLGKDGAPSSLDTFSLTLQVNLVGMFNFVRCAASAMAANQPDDNGERGVLVMTASIAAFDGQIGQAAYTASKAGVAGMTLPIARELARSGIRICTIAPGTFDTPMLAMLPEPARAALAEQIPFPKRLGKPTEFAALARHIAENPMLNGETIRLDGSLRMPPK